MSAEVRAKLQGRVSGITNFGAFIDLSAGETGLVYISEVSNGYVKGIHDALGIGDEVTVKVISVNDDGRIGLSIRKAQEQPVESEEGSYPKKFQQESSRDNRNCLAQKKSLSHSQPPAQREDFDPLMDSFLKDSDDCLSSLRRNTEGKHGGHGGRRS